MPLLWSIVLFVPHPLANPLWKGHEPDPELEFLNSVLGLGGIELSYLPARLHRLAEFHSLESIPGSINV
jgi:hypothetical protein